MMSTIFKSIVRSFVTQTRPLWRHFVIIEEEPLRIGLEGIFAHKLRSFLTMLGIIFGVAAVISMLAIGEGARQKTLAQIRALGLNNIIVLQKKAEEEQADEKEEQKRRFLNFQDVDAIDHILATVNRVVPVVETSYEAVHEKHKYTTTLTGSSPDYFSVMSLSLQKGGFFSGYDNDRYQRVCVLGSEAAKRLFPGSEALGSMIRVEKIWLRVVGVLQRQPVSTAGAEQVDLNTHIFAPIKMVNVRFGRAPDESPLQQIIIRVEDQHQVVNTANMVDRILFRRHRQNRDYSLIVPERLLQQSEETQRMFNIVMGAIAGISLLVGGIGIMNIMLASILERTREIGVRRSLGAKKRDVLSQFLIEAVLLSLLGGVIGVVLGYGLSFGITLFSDWKTSVTWWSVILAFGVSSGVGIVFGYYPARKAAELNPIDALRYE